MPRDLRLLAGAVFLSAAGDLLALIVLALQVHELTGSGLAVSALFATTLVPMVALAPLAGLVGDRFESVRVLVVASLLQALVAAALAFTSDLAAILALSSLLTAANAFAQPAEFALVPAVAGTRPVAQATGILESARYAGFAAGPLLAGALATLGPRPALLVNAASFIAIAVAVGALRARRRPQTGATREKLRALDGFRQLRRDRVLRVTLGAAVGGLLFISASLTVEIFYLKDVVGASDAAYALLLCVWMAGMVCGATALAKRVPTRLVATAALARARRPGLRHGPADRLGGPPGRVRGLPDRRPRPRRQERAAAGAAHRARPRGRPRPRVRRLQRGAQRRRARSPWVPAACSSPRSARGRRCCSRASARSSPRWRG